MSDENFLPQDATNFELFTQPCFQESKQSRTRLEEYSIVKLNKNGKTFHLHFQKYTDEFICPNVNLELVGL